MLTLCCHPTGPRTGGVLRAAPAVGPRALRPCPLPDRLLRSLRQRVGPKGAAPLDNTPTPAPLGPPAVPPMEGRPMPPIKPSVPFKEGLPLETIITADLETLQGKGGPQIPFMAEWYGVKGGLPIGQVFELPNYDSPEAMLRAFWLSIINGATNSTVYLHNWAGYDSILSLAALLSHHDSGLNFTPIIRNGQIISLKVQQGSKVLLTIKDSFKLLPASLAKLAKDYNLEQGKDHFPHYFLLDSLEATMSYTGPAYHYFEPKRTSKEAQMVAQFGEHWNFMKMARAYLHLDCVLLYQVLEAFFKELNTQFELNPITNLSIPGVAFKAWKQHQLPLLLPLQLNLPLPPLVPLGPRTGPEDQGPPVLGPVGGPRAGCGIVCSRRGWDLRWVQAAPFGPTLCRRLRSSLSGRGQGRRALGPTAGAARRTPPVLGPVGGFLPLPRFHHRLRRSCRAQ